MNKYQGHSKQLIVILVMLFLYIPCTFSQSTEAVKSITKSKITASEKIKKIEKLISIKKENGGDSLHYFYHDYAYWLYSYNKDKAIEYEEKAYELGKSQSIIDTLLIQESARDLGFYYQQKKELRKAVSRYREAINIDSDSKIANLTYGALAYCADLIDDYYTAIEYYELVVKNNKTTPGRLLNYYQNLTGVCRKTRSEEGYRKGRKYGAITDSLANWIMERDSALLIANVRLHKSYKKSSKLQDLDKAEKYKFSADSLQKRVDRLKSKQFRIKLNLAQLYNQHRYSDIERSAFYYNQALNLAFQIEDSSRISEVYYGFGTLFLRQNIDYQKSIAFHKRAISFARNTDSLQLFLNNHGLAKAYARQEQYQKSIYVRNVALRFLTGLNFDSPSTILSVDLIGQSEKTYLLRALTDHAETYLKYYEVDQKTVYLDKSIAYFDLADQVIDLLDLNRTTRRSRLFWRKSSSELYTKAIKACYLKNDIDKAFYFSEKNKALLLMEDLAQQRFKQSLELSQNIIDEEQQLKEEIMVMESYISNTNLDYSLKNDSLKKQLADTKIKLSSLNEAQYSSDALFALKPDVISLKEVQSNLENDEMVLEYHIPFDEGFGIYTNDDQGYLICITKESTEIIEISGLKQLRKMVGDVSNWFNKPYEVDDDIQSFSRSSNKLLLRLFPTNRIQELIKRHRVFVIADSFLSTLPFEALSVSGDSLRHLIHETEISYLYSNSFQNQLEQSKVSGANMLAMAPGNFSDPSITPLTNSKREVTNFKPNYSGKYFFEHDATKENFLSNVGSADIIHLATHADIGELSSPWIAFVDGKIQQEELYLTQNNAWLVVLSGCNTAIGQEAVGEGLMSLARGFFYSGAQTVISTLWSIDDNSTTQIVNDFYVNLRAGQRKSEALRNAKLKYLNTHSFSELSPHFWASFVLLGGDDVLTEDTDYTDILYVLALLLGIGFISTLLYLRKYKAHS